MLEKIKKVFQKKKTTKEKKEFNNMDDLQKGVAVNRETKSETKTETKSETKTETKSSLTFGK